MTSYLDLELEPEVPLQSSYVLSGGFERRLNSLGSGCAGSDVTTTAAAATSTAAATAAAPLTTVAPKIHTNMDDAMYATIVSLVIVVVCICIIGYKRHAHKAQVYTSDV